jgi:hypothetical protein
MTSRVALQINRVRWTWGKEKDKSQSDDSHLFCRLETGPRSQAAGISAKGHAYSGNTFRALTFPTLEQAETNHVPATGHVMTNDLYT